MPKHEDLYVQVPAHFTQAMLDDQLMAAGFQLVNDSRPGNAAQYMLPKMPAANDEKRCHWPAIEQYRGRKWVWVGSLEGKRLPYWCEDFLSNTFAGHPWELTHDAKFVKAGVLGRQG